MRVWGKVFLLLAIGACFAAWRTNGNFGHSESMDRSGGTGVVIFSTRGDEQFAPESWVSGLFIPPYDRASECSIAPVHGEPAIRFTEPIFGNRPNWSWRGEPVWHIYELQAGEYVFSTLRVDGRQVHRTHNWNGTITMGNEANIFRVSPGQVTYAGDYMVSADFERFVFNMDPEGISPIEYIGHDDDTAAEVLASFIYLPQDLISQPSETAPHTCGPYIDEIEAWNETDHRTREEFLEDIGERIDEWENPPSITRPLND